MRDGSVSDAVGPLQPGTAPNVAITFFISEQIHYTIHKQQQNMNNYKLSRHCECFFVLLLPGFLFYSMLLCNINKILFNLSQQVQAIMCNGVMQLLPSFPFEHNYLHSHNIFNLISAPYRSITYIMQYVVE